MPTLDWTAIRYFKPSEFDSPDAANSGLNMQPDFVFALDAIREKCGFPFTIDSGFRTPGHNLEVGGVDGSAHTRGWAADISTAHRISGIANWRRYMLIKAAVEYGIQRIGIGDTFVHLDMDPDLPQPRIWLY